MDLKEIQEIVESVTDVVNTFGDGQTDTFIHQMSFQHKTLQQSFTRLCFKWIEAVASDEYKVDGRNQHSHEICKKVVSTMKPLNNGFEISKTIPCV